MKYKYVSRCVKSQEPIEIPEDAICISTEDISGQKGIMIGTVVIHWLEHVR